MSKSLKTRIIDYLMQKNDWVPSGELQRLTIERAHQTGKTCSRRLQELVEEKKLQVDYFGPHKHAHYKIRDGVIIPRKIPNFLQGVGHLPSYEELERQGKI